MTDHGWIIGVSLTFSARIINNVGIQLQKHAHRNIQASDIGSKYVSNSVWLFGLLFQIIGALFDFFALGFAPQTLIAPLATVSLIINMVLTPVMQKETVTVKTIIVTLLMTIATVITIVFSPKNHSNYDSIEDVMGLYLSYYFLCYAIITVLLLILFRYLAWKHKANDRIYAFSVTTISGIMGAQNVLFSKGASTPIILTIENGDECFALFWQWYLLLIALLCSVYFHVKWLNIGLKNFSPISVIPNSTTSQILVAIMGGLTVYKEYDDFKNETSMILFIVGVLSTVLTVLGLSTVTDDKGNGEGMEKYELNQTDVKLEFEEIHSTPVDVEYPQILINDMSDVDVDTCT
eukprot:17409_1